MRLTIDIDDDLELEVEQRAGDRTWSELVSASLRYALDEADAEQHDSQPSDDETEHFA
jgi:Arc/MetJ family transcription regulator